MRTAGGYDEFAWLYEMRWGDISLAFLPTFERLALNALPVGRVTAVGRAGELRRADGPAGMSETIGQ